MNLKASKPNPEALVAKGANFDQNTETQMEKRGVGAKTRRKEQKNGNYRTWGVGIVGYDYQQRNMVSAEPNKEMTPGARSL